LGKTTSTISARDSSTVLPRGLFMYVSAFSFLKNWDLVP
jgi:hypothetical protein